MNENAIMELENRHLAVGYQKLPVTLVKGKAAIVWDANGKEYIDCMTGYGVAIIGHCNPRVVEAIRNQAEILITCHGSLYSDVRAALLQKLIEIVPKGLDRVFLVNSGAEATECAMKIARKYTGRKEIVAMTGSYHGRTLGALSATWNPKYRRPFEPLVPGFRFVPFGHLNEVEEAISDKTAAVILEPIQGESGVHLPPDGFLKGLRDACDKKGIALIFDEIQSGFGRTGRMWACEHWSVTPDILCAGKGVAGGVPMSATFAKDEIMKSFKTGDHSSTFGGNPLACAASLAAIQDIQNERLVEKAVKLGAIFKDGLLNLMKKYRTIRNVRGLGLMLALEIRFDIRDVLQNGLNEGLLMLYSGRNTIRLLPPLAIEEAQINKALSILDRIIAIEESKLEN